jgi:nitroreductase
MGSRETLAFDTDVCTLIERRRSVRSYRPGPLAPEARAALSEACEALRTGPLGSPCRFGLVDRRTAPPPDGSVERLGTYGVIRGASTYLAGAAVQGPFCLPDFGYLFQLLVLRATDLGLGTCWLGGTFRRSDFGPALGLKEGELLPAVSPVGVPAGRRGLVDRAFRAAAGSNHRRPWEELFFDSSGRPLAPEREEEPYRVALEMVRLAPSASNRQPWRLVRDSGTVHFFLEHTQGYGGAMGFDLQRLDMGIAMAHFELAFRARASSAAEGYGWEAAVGSAVEASAPSRTARAAGKLSLDARTGPALPGFHKLEYVISWRTKAQAS